MNSKFREIGMAVSGMMCAVMLFTCALPVKAAVVCPHTSRCMLDPVDTVEVDHYSDNVHYVWRENQACCEQCGMIIVLNTELRTEPHDIRVYINETSGFTLRCCTECHYSKTYYDTYN